MKRLGLFYIPAQQIEDDPETVRAIMGWCIPVRVNFDPFGVRYAYEALSDGFAEIADDAAAPEYTATRFKDEGIVQFYPVG